MKKLVKRLLERVGLDVRTYDQRNETYKRLFRKYSEYTMTHQNRFTANLELCDRFGHQDGDYVECGVWRGGMSAAIAEIIGKGRMVHLFDSFEGLPAAREIDGEAALTWQKDIDSPFYYDNCKEEERFAIEAMRLAGHEKYRIYKGWFENTLPEFGSSKISILRLDGDWYDSIMTSLQYLYPLVAENGLVILDDYQDWAGCSRAVHKYLSEIGSSSRIQQTSETVTFLIKKEK